jgi:sulfatase modifying factor 1
MGKKLLGWSFIIAVLVVFTSCKHKAAPVTNYQPASLASPNKAICCESNIPSRFPGLCGNTVAQGINDRSHKGMVWIKGGTFMMGGDVGFRCVQDK